MKNPIVRFNWADTTANGYPDLYKYMWGTQDFDLLENNDLRALINGAMEGLARGSVASGAELSTITGLNFTVASGIALGRSGELLVLQTAATAALPSPTAAAGANHLVVLRPVETATGVMAKPTDPGNNVPLCYVQQAQLLVLDGNGGGNPPSAGASDVVLFSVRLAQSAVAFTSAANVSRQLRDLPGRRSVTPNGSLGALPQAFDRRMYAYPNAGNSVGITPSQTVAPFPKSVLFASGSSGVASKFPLSAGAFNGDAGDTFLNFTTGAITGADVDSPDFTPTIPAANTFIWALVQMSPTTDLLSVTYGTQGTYAQCQAALRNQTIAGAGSLPSTNTGFRVALVLVGSSSGAAATEVDVYDARSFCPATPSTADAIVTVTTANSPYVMTGTEQTVELDATLGSVSVTLPSRAAQLGRGYSFDRIDTAEANTALVNRAGADTFDEPVNTTSYPFDPYQSQNFFAGSAKWKIRG